MKKYLDKHGIKDGVLREFVTKEKWTEAAKSCWDAIGKREQEIVALKNLIELIEEKK